MRLPPLLAVFCVLAPGGGLWAQPASPSDIDASQQAEGFTPAATVPVVRLPDPADRRAPEARHILPWLRDSEKAAIGDDRAPIDVTEAKPKDVRPINAIERREFVVPESTVSTAKSADRFATTKRLETPGLAKRYRVDRLPEQDIRIKKSDPRASDEGERVGFSRINRFTFRKNRPTLPDDAVPTTPAGGRGRSR